MTWATKEDLYARFGDEVIDKLAIRSDWDKYDQSYVANESCKAKDQILDLALEDAKNLIIHKLSCIYSNYSLVQSEDFVCPVLKQWHIKTTFEVLKAGGDCSSCNCEKLDEFLKCNTLCSDGGVCLSRNSTFISASVAKFPCECGWNCKCC